MSRNTPIKKVKNVLIPPANKPAVMAKPAMATGNAISMYASSRGAVRHSRP